MARLAFTGFEDFALNPLPPVGNMTEVLEFRTDIFTSHNGTETRYPSRTTARHALRYDVQAGLLRRQVPFNLADQNLRGNWAVPQWTDAVAVPSLSGTSLTCNTRHSDFRDGELVIAMQTLDNWQVRQVDTVSETGFTVTEAFDAMQGAYVMPVQRARIRGEVDYKLASFESVFSTNYSLQDPRRFPTKLGVMFAMDISNSMLGDRFDAMIANVRETVLMLKGCVVNSGVNLDLRLCFWNTVALNYTYLQADADDMDAALAAIDAQAVSGGTTPIDAFNSAVTFFTSTSPNPGDREDFLFFATDADASLTSSAAAAYDLINEVAPYAGAKRVRIYAINIDVADTVQALKVDNASGGVITNVTADTPYAMLDRFNGALLPVVGYQYGGYEILTPDPISEGSAGKSVFMQEDILDFDIAPYVTRTPWDATRVTHSHSFLFEAGEESYNMRRFLYRRQGAARPFALPSYQNDLNLLELQAGRTQAIVDKKDFDAFNTDRRTIGIRFTDGSWQGNTITDVSETIYDQYLLTFDRELFRDLDEVNQVCYMGVARLSSDRIEMKWIGNKAVSMSLRMVELSK
jgi:hypothetical protein